MLGIPCGASLLVALDMKTCGEAEKVKPYVRTYIAYSTYDRQTWEIETTTIYLRFHFAMGTGGIAAATYSSYIARDMQMDI